MSTRKKWEERLALRMKDGGWPGRHEHKYCFWFLRDMENEIRYIIDDASLFRTYGDCSI